jgi:hypothetical protein
MLANAILELWKKETGSLSPVVIEGTICITAGSGRTTVVQVSNHFSGSIPDALQDSGPLYHTPKRKMLSLRPHSYGSARDAFGSPPPFPSFQDSGFLMSPHSAPPVGKSPQMFSTPAPMKLQRKSNSLEQSMDISHIKDESDDDDGENDDDGKDDEDEDDNEKELHVDVLHDSSAADVIPGTGLYVQDRKEGDADDSKESEIDVTGHDPTEDELDNAFEKAPETSTPEAKSDGSSSRSPVEGDALDLSSGRKEDDLALSLPQNYTAQVRNVIRQRLLASRQNSTEVKESPSSSETSTERSSIESSTDRDSTSQDAVPTTPLPPLMNLNLNSPAMLAMQYGPLGMKVMAPPAPIHDLLTSNRPPAGLMSPDAYSPRPSSTGSFDQNGNNKDTLYVNDKGESQKVYRCNFCSKTFLFKSKYYEHLPVHTNVRPFQCHLCSRTYKYKYDLRVHLRTHMGIPTKSTVCPFCSVKFETNKMLRLHIQDFHRGCVVSDQNMMSPSDGSPANDPEQQEGVSTV